MKVERVPKQETPVKPVEIYPMRNKQYKAFRQFYGMYRVLQASAPMLEKRFKSVPTLWRDYKLMQYLAKRIWHYIFITIPKEDYDHAIVDCTNTRCEVITNQQLVVANTQYTVVPVSALKSMIDHVAKWDCCCCEKHGQMALSCPLRKEFNRLVPFEYEDGKSEKCPFAIGMDEVM